jgi:hypothetical protein
MDAIRKKMQSLKGETDSLYATIARYDESTKHSNGLADQVSFFCPDKERGSRDFLLSRPVQHSDFGNFSEFSGENIYGLPKT